MFKTNLLAHVVNTARSYRLMKRPMELSAVVSILDGIAPLHLAEKWDNVGLLVEANKSKKVNTILMTNDLTKSVLTEAVGKNIDLIISYHPPIFVPLKSLTTSNWKQRVILQCIQSSISIYSPHTALDAFSGGVNDWLISCFDMNEIKPIQQSFSSPNYTHRIDVHLPIGSELVQKLDQVSGISLTERIANGMKLVRILADTSSLVNVMQVMSSDASILGTVEIYKLDMNPLPGSGMGRIGNLSKAITVGEALNILKHHVGLKHLRVALGNDHTLDSSIKKIAVCAGSGSSILQQANADLFITGEMSHHDLLNATHKNTSVFLCEHSNSERGFLQRYTKILQESLQGVTVLISENDRDPITIV